MAIDLQALKDEITTNPASMPYPAFTPENDVAIADILNNADGSNPRTVNNATVDTGVLRGLTTLAAWSGLKNSAEAWYKWLTQNGVLPVNTETLSKLAGIPNTNDVVWGSSEEAEMTAAMAAVMRRQGSRAEEIADTIGVSSVTPSQVANARNLP